MQRVTEVTSAKGTKKSAGKQGKHRTKSVRNQRKRTMKATKLTIGFREWSKLADFVETINEEDEMVAYQIDITTALLVAAGECGLAWIEAQAAQWFEDYYTTIVK